MAKRSLLEMTQGILNAMDSDEISSISDTIEAQQVARVIEDTYWDLIDEHDLPHNFDLFALEGLADKLPLPSPRARFAFHRSQRGERARVRGAVNLKRS